MPMIPSGTAASTYGALKIVGYAVYAHWLNRRLKARVSPIKFGLVKTLVGFAFGWFLLAFGSRLPEALQSDFGFWLSAFPLRLLGWLLVIAYFYRSKITHWQLLGFSMLGVVISYALDLLMFALFDSLPGMEMPIC